MPDSINSYGYPGEKYETQSPSKLHLLYEQQIEPIKTDKSINFDEYRQLLDGDEGDDELEKTEDLQFYTNRDITAMMLQKSFDASNH